MTAVLVCHDGARWLPRVLAALAVQTRPVDELVVVDTGSRDGTSELLAASLPPGARLLQRPRRTSFGSAVAAAVATLGESAVADGPTPSAGATDAWLWILHDDRAPASDALAALLAHAEDHPLADVLGCKVRGWHDRRALLEVGFTTSRSGRRDTGLEPLEQDQGQHDTAREVLAVGTAGMLVRLPVWRALGGLDPRMPLYRDDLDLCWQVWRSGGEVHVVTRAVVAHAEAATLGRRVVSVRGRRPHYLDRRHAALTLLRHRSLALLPLLMLRVVLGGLVRTGGFLLGKAPGFAIDEARALVALVLRPDQLLVGRWRRRRRVAALRRSRSAVTARPTPPLTPPRVAARHAWESLLAIGSGAASALAVGTRARRTARYGTGADETGAVETGPVAEDAQDLAAASSTVLGLLRRPVVLLLLGLLVTVLVADRGLYGSGRLVASGMLPAPNGAADWWHLVRWPWHDSGGGTAEPGPLWALVLAALSVLTLGSAPLAVDLLVLGAVPLAALSAALSLRGLVRTTPLRVAAALVWAAQPLVLVAVARGTLPVLVAAVVLPPAAAALVRLLGSRDRVGTARAGAAGALAVAVLGAFVPAVAALVCSVALLAALGVLAVHGLRRLTRAGSRRGAQARRVSVGGLLVLALLPPVMLLPDVARVSGRSSKGATSWLDSSGVAHWLLGEAGTPVAAWPGTPTPWHVLLGVPEAVPVLGDLAGAATAALALLAVLALLRRDRRGAAARAWLASLVALAAVVALAFIREARTDLWGRTAGPGRGLVGVLGLCVVAALIVAVLSAATGLGEVLARHRFGWRQPVVAVVATAAVAVPAVALGAVAFLGAGHAGDLQRRTPLALPAYVAAAAQTGEAPRSLLLADDARSGSGVVHTALVGRMPPRLGDERFPAAPTALVSLVGDLAAGRVPDAGTALAPWAIRFVVATPPVSARLAAALDTTPGLARVGGQHGTQVWEVDGPTPRAVLLAGNVANGAPGTQPVGLAAEVDVPTQVLPVAAVPGQPLDRQVAAAGSPRLLRLSEAPDEGWQATLDGRPLTRVDAANALVFRLPAGAGGRLRVWHDDDGFGLLVAALAAFALTVVLALPGMRREQRDLEPAPDGERAGENEPVPTRVPVPSSVAAVPAPGQRAAREEPELRR
ncbi:MAG: glycosyltransferase [Actinomycetes bacterium]